MLAAISLAAFLPYIAWLLQTWASLHVEYTLTGLLAVPVAAGLAYLTKRRIPAAGPADPLGWWVLGAAHGLNLVGTLTGLYGLSGLAFPPALLAVVALLRGRAMAKHLLMPTSFLLFLMPLPWLLRPALAVGAQEASAIVGYLLLLPTGLDVMLQGVYVYTPDYYVIVNDTCSGLQTACALLMYGIVIGHLLDVRGTRAAVLLLAVLPVGLLINGGRVAFLLVLGHKFGRGAAIGMVHDLSSVAFFAVAYWILYRLARRLLARSEAIIAQTTQGSTSPVR